MSRRLRARLCALTRFPSLSPARSTSAVVRWAVRIAELTATVVLMLVVSGATNAHADIGTAAVLAANSLPQVISNMRLWLMGILWSLAGLCGLIGAIYRMTAMGDPIQVEKGNTALRNAAIGAALAVLVPVILTIVRQIVGG